MRNRGSFRVGGPLARELGRALVMLPGGLTSQAQYVVPRQAGPGTPPKTTLFRRRTY